MEPDGRKTAGPEVIWEASELECWELSSSCLEVRRDHHSRHRTQARDRQLLVEERVLGLGPQLVVTGEREAVLELDVLHQGPGRAHLLLAHGAGQGQGLTVGRVRLRVQLLSVLPVSLLLIIQLARAGDAGRPNTLLHRLVVLLVLHLYPSGDLGLLLGAVGGLVLDVGHELLERELGVTVPAGQQVTPCQVSPSSCTEHSPQLRIKSTQTTTNSTKISFFEAEILLE